MAFFYVESDANRQIKEIIFRPITSYFFRFFLQEFLLVDLLLFLMLSLHYYIASILLKEYLNLTHTNV